jgi:GNAT superfamily N-acetyltransferase
MALQRSYEKCLLEYMNQDRISHFYPIYDVLHMREKTRAWLSLLGSDLFGYLIEFDRRILCLRGDADAAPRLLEQTDLTTALFNIEPSHLSSVKEIFEPVAPADKMTSSKISAFTPMLATRDGFKPAVRHRAREVVKDEVPLVADLLGVDRQTASELLGGYAFGVFKRGKLVSFAASPNVLDNLAIVRGVFTAAEERNRGYSKSVCSVLVDRLLRDGKDVFLYVSRDNAAAMNVYSSLGFGVTGHVVLSFWAQRKTD